MSGGGLGKIAKPIGSIVGDTIGLFSKNRAARGVARAYGDTRAEYKEGLSQEQERLDPYAQAGGFALSNLTGLITGNQFDPETGEFKSITPEGRMQLFQESPGYQFRLAQSIDALDKSNIAQGQFGGGALKEIVRYSQGLASDEYGGYLDSLTNLATAGQTAATNQSNFGVGGLGNIANLGLGARSYEANKYSNIGQFAQTQGPRLGQIAQSFL